MKEIKIIYLLLWFALIASISGCHKKQVFCNNYFSIKIEPNWNLIESDSMKYRFMKDTAYFKINIHKETKLYNVLLRTPDEYIKTEDANLLTNFAFLNKFRDTILNLPAFILRAIYCAKM